MAASTTAARNLISLRVASMAENSTSEVCFLALTTDFAAIRITSSLDFFNWCFRWISEVEIKVWSRGDFAPLIASQARSMSGALALARAATLERVIVLLV